MTKPPSPTVHVLDLDDLDRVVGGVARGASAEAASHQDHEARTEAFLSSVHDAAAIAGQAAGSAGHSPPLSHPAEVTGDAHALAAGAYHVAHDLHHPHEPGDGVMDDPLAHHAIALSLGAEAVHDLVAAHHLVAALGAYAGLSGDGHQGDRDGMASASTARRESFEQSLGHGSDDWSAGAAVTLTIEALKWETRFLHDIASAADTITATEPTFAAQTRAVLAETRHVLEGILAAARQGSET